MNYIQNAIFKGNEKMEQFKLQLEWNQNDLETWALAQKQKEEDNLAMQKYTRADETRIKELTLQIEKLTERVSTTKRELEDEVTETQAKQIELDKTAEEFRKLHRERQDLVKQWEEAITTMQKRDVDIQKAQERCKFCFFGWWCVWGGGTENRNSYFPPLTGPLTHSNSFPLSQQSWMPKPTLTSASKSLKITNASSRCRSRRTSRPTTGSASRSGRLASSASSGRPAMASCRRSCRRSTC